MTGMCTGNDSFLDRWFRGSPLDMTWLQRDYEQARRNEERAASWAVRCRVVPRFVDRVVRRVWSWEGRKVSKPQRSKK